MEPNPEATNLNHERTPEKLLGTPAPGGQDLLTDYLHVGSAPHYLLQWCRYCKQPGMSHTIRPL